MIHIDLIEGRSEEARQQIRRLMRRAPTSLRALDTSYLATAPVMLVILVDLTALPAVDSGLDRLSISTGASVYPLAHNILLAARDAGYGGHFTSVLARQEPALRELLGIPKTYALATMLPLGKPTKEITKPRGAKVETFTTVERFDGPAFAV